MKTIFFIYLLSPLSAISQGVGFPPASNPMTGGSAGQVLVKSSSTSYDWTWSSSWQGSVIGITYGGTGQSTASAGFNALAPSKTGNTLKYLRVNAGETDYELVTLAGGGDMIGSNNLSDLTNITTARSNLGVAIGTNVQAFDADLTTWAGITPTTIGTNVVSLTNPSAVGYIRANADNTVTHRSYANTKVDLSLDAVENTALSTWAGTTNVTTVGTIGTGTWNATAIADGKIASALTGKTYNGLTITSSTGTLTIANGKTATVNNSVTIAGTDGVTTTLPAVAGTVMLNTSTSGVAATPTASGTTTVTHNLGRIPTIIRIYSISSFTSNAAATPVPFSNGIFNSTGNRCLYMVINGTTSQVSQTSTVFSIIMVTSAGNQITGVIGNLTSTGFDIVWTETGTHTAGNYLWEAQ